MGDEHERFEIIKSIGPNEVTVELWDNSLAPGGLAFEVVANDDGSVAVTGYRVAVPFADIERFLNEAKSYLAPKS